MKMLFIQKKCQGLNRKSVFFYEKYVKNFPVSVDGAIMSFVENIYIRTVSSYHLISALLNWFKLVYEQLTCTAHYSRRVTKVFHSVSVCFVYKTHT